MEGAHPEILKRLAETNLVKSAGYGMDEYSEAAKSKIRNACDAPDADVFFLVGGTQTNATVIDALLRSYQGVISAETGHVNVHEAGAIEFGGHKVMALKHTDGKLSAAIISKALKDYREDANHEHMVMPGMVYISQPTEYGTLYTLKELEEISAVCREHKVPLYLDGARLAYALACPENDVELKDIARLCDVFYIGGTKCGALFGEAVVMPKQGYIPHFFTIIKQHGALLAKGRLLGIQFDTLFTDGLYKCIGENAMQAAKRIRNKMHECGLELCFNSPTNQIFCLAENELAEKLMQEAEFSFWEKPDDTHMIVRCVTDWATAEEDVDALCELLESLT